MSQGLSLNNQSLPMNTSSPLVGFDENIERLYLTLLDIGTWLSVFAHLFFYRLVFLSTPKEMFNYKMTVTNTSTWCLLMTIFFGVLLRPVPLFPIPAAKVTGPLKKLGAFWGGNCAWICSVLCTANFLCAAMNCFAVLAIFLLNLQGFFGRLSRFKGISMGIFNQLVTTAVVVLFMTCVYAPVPDLKSILLSRHSSELAPLISPDDVVIFGYDSANGLNLMAPIVLLLFLVQGNIVTTLYVMLVRKIWAQIKKSNAEQTARHRRNVVLMLTARMTSPTLFGSLPLMIICAFLWLSVRNAFAFYCALTAIAITHGFFNVMATIVAYRPYRLASVQLFFLVLHIFGFNIDNQQTDDKTKQQQMNNNGQMPTTNRAPTGHTVTRHASITVHPQRKMMTNVVAQPKV